MLNTADRLNARFAGEFCKELPMNQQLQPRQKKPYQGNAQKAKNK
jgi:hypothetical protein